MAAYTRNTGRKFATSALLAAALGCSRTPQVTLPHVDPESAVNAAFELYDTDNSSALDRQELAKCPALLTRLEAYDQDSSGTIDRQEMAARVQELLLDKAGLARLKCQVTYQGKPLADAEVVFEPESYLGDEIKPASGVTNQQGLATIKIADEHLSQVERKLKPLHYGTYKVRITHPRVKLPPKYNTQTELGYETAIGNPYVTFALK